MQPYFFTLTSLISTVTIRFPFAWTLFISTCAFQIFSIDTSTLWWEHWSLKSLENFIFLLCECFNFWLNFIHCTNKFNFVYHHIKQPQNLRTDVTSKINKFWESETVSCSQFVFLQPKRSPVVALILDIKIWKAGWLSLVSVKNQMSFTDLLFSIAIEYNASFLGFRSKRQHTSIKTLLSRLNEDFILK